MELWQQRHVVVLLWGVVALSGRGMMQDKEAQKAAEKGCRRYSR